MARIATPRLMVALLVAMFALAALLRPLDHDESQYVAAAALSGAGGFPYASYAYLQTPLQPVLLGPLAAVAGVWTWPALRLVNALLGALAVAGVYRAARAAGVARQTALAAGALLGCCDIFLFSVGTARNDALPAALFALALPFLVRAARGEASRSGAALAGLLLAATAAAKISYLLPAVACGVIALLDRRQRAVWLAAGALPIVALLGYSYAAAPAGFMFGVFDFPSRAPAQYYLSSGRGWKLGYLAKAVDTLKFLLLGPALLALSVVAADRRRDPVARMLDVLIVAGLVAALLPFPTWRQYLLPALIPAFVRLALAWQAAPPGRAVRVAAIVFAAAGLTPTVIAVGQATGGVPIIAAMRQSAAIRTALDAAGVAADDRVVTLSPQFLPATGRLPDRRLATGPFYFRSRALLDMAGEKEIGAISRDRIDTLATAGWPAPDAILVGGEGPWTSGDAALDAVLERWAVAHRYRAVAIPGGRFRLYLRPR